MNNMTFYFSVCDKLYEISRKHLPLVPFFNTLAKHHPNDGCSALDAIEIRPMEIIDDCSLLPKYNINTREMYDFLMKYIDIWKDNIAGAHYITKPPQHLGFYYQILHESDLKAINEYLEPKLAVLNDKSEAFRKLYTVALINQLLRFVNGYLNMKCLTNKLYAYCAVCIWECSILEVEEMQDNPFFKLLQTNDQELINDSMKQFFN